MCLAGGMVVETDQGPVPIEEVRPGDTVLSVPEHDPYGAATFEVVTRVFAEQAEWLLVIELEDGGQLSLTGTHVVWGVGRGWIAASELREGDGVLGPEGLPRIIASIRREPGPRSVYTLSVASGRTFFAQGVWVHNAGCDLQLLLESTKRLPNEMLSKRPPARGKAPMGIDGNAIEIHHVDQNPMGPFEELLKRDHVKISNRRPGLTAEERQEFNRLRKQYWEVQWDSGRFDHLHK